MAYPFNTASRIPCEVEGCDTDFARQADMQRHVKEHHGGLLICTVPNCPWRGAKRKSRLDEHLKKKHGNYPEVDLVVPQHFGSPSPTISPYLPAQNVQPGIPVAGTTDTYVGYNDASSYPRTVSYPTDPIYSVTQTNPMLLPASQYEGTQTYANAPPPNAGTYNTSFGSYPPQEVAPSDGYAPNPSYAYAANQYQAPIGDGAASGSGHQDRDGGRRKKKRSHRS